jgi:hypothetical protein
MKNRLRLLTLFILIVNNLWAQQTYPVTDTLPLLINGLNIGYHIKSTEVKAVKDKGNFSRYAIRFYVTNTANTAIIIPYREGWNQPGNEFDLLAKFDILNATGARFTSKTALIHAMPYKTFTLADEKDPHSNKIIQVKRSVQVGYFIQAGQSIFVDEIVITPLNQLPNVQAVYFANALPPGPPVIYAGNPGMVQNIPSPPVINMQGFLRFKNVFNNTYINVQTGMPVSSTINNGWWSAQWQLIPIAGTNYFNIKNRWRGNFMDTDRGSIITSLNSQSPGSMWSMEPTRNPNVFRIKNAQTGGYLSIANNNLVLFNSTGNDFSSAWQVEQP